MKKNRRNSVLIVALLSLVLQSSSLPIPVMGADITSGESISTDSNKEAKTTISIDGFKKTIDTIPEQKDNKVYVGVKDILNINLGVTLEWHDPSSTLNVMKGNDLFLQIVPGKSYIFAQGQRIDGDYTIYINDSKTDIMVPLDVIKAEFELTKAEYDEAKNIITIETNKEAANKLTASKKEGIPLTLEEAIDKALNVDSSLKSVDENERNVKSQRDDLAKKYITYSEGNSPILGTSSDLDMVRSLMSLDISIEAIPYQKELAEKQVREGIKTCFNNILGYEKDLAFKNSTIEHSKKLLDVAKKRVELGLMSQFDYDQQKLKYDQLLKDISTIEYNIKNEYSNLSILMDSNEDYVIDYTVDSYTPIGQIDIDAYASQHAYSTPSIRIQEYNVKKAEQDLRTATSDNLTTKENAVSQAVRDLADSKDNIEKNVRSTYSQIIEAEKEYNKSLENLDQLNKELEVLKVKYNVGAASSLDIENKNFDILTQQYQIEKTILSLDMARYKFDRI